METANPVSQATLTELVRCIVHTVRPLRITREEYEEALEGLTIRSWLAPGTRSMYAAHF